MLDDKNYMLLITDYVSSIKKETIKPKKADVFLEVNLPKYTELISESLRKINTIKANKSAVILDAVRKIFLYAPKENEDGSITMERKLISESKFSDKDIDINLINRAFQEVEESLRKSYDKNITEATSKKPDFKGEYIGNGLFFNEEKNCVYVVGRLKAETVHDEGKIDKSKATVSKPITVAKDFIQQMLPNSLKIYKIETSEFRKLKVVPKR